MCCIHNRKISFTPPKDYTFIKGLWLCRITSNITGIRTQQPLMDIRRGVFWCIFKFWSQQKHFLGYVVLKNYTIHAAADISCFPLFITFSTYSCVPPTFHKFSIQQTGRSWAQANQEPRLVGIDKTPGTCSIRARLTSTTKIIRQSRASTRNVLLSARRKVWDSYFFTPVRPGKTSNFWNNEKTNDAVQSNLMAF